MRVNHLDLYVENNKEKTIRVNKILQQGCGLPSPEGLLEDGVVS